MDKAAMLVVVVVGALINKWFFSKFPGHTSVSCISRLVPLSDVVRIITAWVASEENVYIAANSSTAQWLSGHNWVQECLWDRCLWEREIAQSSSCGWLDI